MVGGYYVEIDGEPVPVDRDDWARSFSNDRHVALTSVPGHQVSTVFLGLDHNHSRMGPPILYETMVFVENTADDRFTQRYPTRAAAKRGHALVVAVFEHADLFVISREENFDDVVTEYCAILAQLRDNQET